MHTNKNKVKSYTHQTNVSKSRHLKGVSLDYVRANFKIRIERDARCVLLILGARVQFKISHWSRVVWY